ncbi:MAG: hypothetical protein IT318_08355 [Anaerolineales bacterium]|nr:hypothetical protein [Anaerolineales bacterium]
MSSVSLKTVRSLVNIGSALRTFKKSTIEELAAVDHHLAETLNWVDQRVRHWQKEEQLKQRQIDNLRTELRGLQARATARTDRLARTKVAEQTRVLEDVLRQQRVVSEKLRKAVLWKERLMRAKVEFDKEENRFKNTLLNHTHKAQSRLGILISKYQAIYHYRLSPHSTGSLETGAEFDRQALNPSTLASEGQHGALFQRAKQAFKLRTPDDSNAPSYIKGWILQEKNSFAKRGYIRNPPGFQVGHRVKGIDDPARFAWENADMNEYRGGKFRR